MNIKNINLKAVVFICLIIFMLFFPSKSNADTGFEEFNNSPRISVETDTSKLSDVKITVKDSSKIEYVKITKKNGTVLTEVDNIKKKKYEYQISPDDLNNKDATLNIEARDTSGLILTKQVKLTVEEKNDKKYYKINSSPTISDFQYAAGAFSFDVKDKNKLKNIKVKNNETVVNNTNISKDLTEKNIIIDLKGTSKNEDENTYSFSIEATDAQELKTSIMINFEITPLQLVGYEIEDGVLKLNLNITNKINITQMQIIDEENNVIYSDNNIENKDNIPISLGQLNTNKKKVKLKVVAKYQKSNKNNDFVTLTNSITVNLENLQLSNYQLGKVKLQWVDDKTWEKMDSKRIKVLEKAMSGVGKIGYVGGGCSLTEDPSALSCSGFVGWAYKWTGNNLNIQHGCKDFIKSNGGCAKVKKIKAKDRLPGDLCVILKKGTYETVHIGMYLGESDDGKMLFIHCSGHAEPTGAKVESDSRFYSDEYDHYWCRYTGFKDNV